MQSFGRCLVSLLTLVQSSSKKLVKVGIGAIFATFDASPAPTGASTRSEYTPLDPRELADALGLIDGKDIAFKREVLMYQRTEEELELLPDWPRRDTQHPISCIVSRLRLVSLLLIRAWEIRLPELMRRYISKQLGGIYDLMVLLLNNSDSPSWFRFFREHPSTHSVLYNWLTVFSKFSLGSLPTRPPLLERPDEGVYIFKTQTNYILGKTLIRALAAVTRTASPTSPSARPALLNFLKRDDAVALEFHRKVARVENLVRGSPNANLLFTENGLARSLARLVTGDNTKMDDFLGFDPGTPFVVCHWDGCEARSKLLKCAKCQIVKYCSTEHQTLDFSLHKRYCRRKVW